MTAIPTSDRWPRRKVLVTLTFFASVIAYTDRVNISVAAVAMKESLGWSQTEKGLVLSSFFLGYLVFMLASGWLATRFGGKRVLGLSVLAWSAFTLLTPLAAALSLPVLLATRVAMGVGEAGMYPAGFELLGRWIPLSERARAAARLLSGVPIGTVVGLLASGWLVGHYGWPMAFYAFGVLGLLWVIIWFRQVSDDPSRDPRVSPDERALLPAALPRAQALGDVPWRRLLLRVPVLAILTAHFASNWCLYVLVSWLPSYFREVQHLSLAGAGLFSAAPWLAMFGVSTLAGSVSDRMIVRGRSVTLTRKLMQCTALLVPAVLLLVLRDVHSAPVALALICVAVGALGCTFCGYGPGIIDVAPRHGALVIGLSNMIATIPGIVGVAVTGWLVEVTGTYGAAFVLTAVVSGVGALIFGTFFQAKPLLE